MLWVQEQMSPSQSLIGINNGHSVAKNATQNVMLILNGTIGTILTTMRVHHLTKLNTW